jgi:hypothetical protein
MEVSMLDSSNPYTSSNEVGKSCLVTVPEAAEAWRAWSPQQRANFGQLVGIAQIWDDAICPAVINPQVISLVPEVVS